MIKPIEQGSMDNLCGLYTVINALRLIIPPSRGRDQKLFQEAVAYLDEKEWLSSVLTEGMPTALFAALARHMNRQHQIAIERVGHSRSQQPEETIMRAVDAGLPVLASVDSPLDHFSVICGYSPTRWLLFDSYGYRWLNRRHCAWNRTKNTRHRLVAWILSPAHKAANCSPEIATFRDEPQPKL